MESSLANGITSSGWEAPTDLTLEQWKGSAQFAVGLGSLVPWIIGDLCNEAMKRGGEFELLALQALPCKPQTAYNNAVIARLYPPDKRNLNLTMAHHRAVAKIARKDLEEAEGLLHLAARSGWDVGDLRKWASGEPESALGAIAAPEVAPTVESSAPDAVAGPLAQAIAVLEWYANCDNCAEWIRADSWLQEYREHINGKENR